MTDPQTALSAIILACPVTVSSREKMELLKDILACGTDDDLRRLADRWLAERKP